MTDEQYQRLVRARAQGRNPDEHAAPHVEALTAILALQKTVLAQRQDIDQLQGELRALRARLGTDSDVAC
jgi:hypothetical protein